MKKLLSLAMMAAFALSLTSCCCDRDPCCEPCPPKPRCCEPRPCAPKPMCPPRCEPKYYDNECCQ